MSIPGPHPSPPGPSPAVTRPQADLVICDIDGCLTPEGLEPFDLPSLAAIRAYNLAARRDRDRPELTLCSGRPQPFVEAMCRLLCIGTPCIAENGVWLYDPATNAYRMDAAITPADLRAVERMAGWLRDRYAGAGAMVQPGKSASVSLYHPDHQWIVAHQEEIRAHAGQAGHPLRISHSWYYVNCDLAHISKATGIDRLMALIGCTRARLAGIGDTMGDAAIRDRVAHFACPANADQRLQELADYVSPAHEAKGVLDILGRLGRA